MTFRDYNQTGPANAQAIASGLVTEDWYRTPIDRKVMKDLMKRSDHPATRDTIVLFALMAALASAAVFIMPSRWSVPFWMAYGVLYGSAMDRGRVLDLEEHLSKLLRFSTFQAL